MLTASAIPGVEFQGANLSCVDDGLEIEATSSVKPPNKLKALRSARSKAARALRGAFRKAKLTEDSRRADEWLDDDHAEQIDAFFHDDDNVTLTLLVKLPATKLAAIKKALEPPKVVAAPPPPKPERRNVVPDFSNETSNYHALIIGNNDYKSFPKLKTAHGDANAVAAALRSHFNFNTTVILDATRAEILKAIYSYRNHLDDEDSLIIYYAGHGNLDEAADQGYWLPVDAAPNDPANWLSISSLNEQLRAMPAKHVLVVSDSCYSGKMTRGMFARPVTRQSPEERFEKLRKNKSRTVLTSGGLEPVLDGSGADGRSVFCGAFIKVLEDAPDTLAGGTLAEHVKRKVKFNADQTPQYSPIRKTGHDDGDFIFVKSSKTSTSE